MFNKTLKNFCIISFLLTSLTLFYGCSSLSKPSEDVIKEYILGKELYSTEDKTNIHFKEFKITNEFKMKHEDENWYCVAINYKLAFNYVKDNLTDTDETIRERSEARFRFSKRGKEWYVKDGWPK
ncbi:MAG: hypothetical protein BWX72_01373 [Firmicutes bacterium ADurb.Bin080]|nr:MAG: hypothetical protein BWX72_01373 [Firmicutes bacterium ADurb.Bin080]